MSDLVTIPIDSTLLDLPQRWLGEGWQLKAFIALAALLMFLWLVRKVRRAVRRRRPVTLHPRLQKYGDPHGQEGGALARQRHAEAARIVATSSTDRITGYEIVEQIEAVFVDSFRSPDQATEGLKAVAAMKGANALVNVRQHREERSQCGASGDAVVVRKRPSNANKSPRASAEGAGIEDDSDDGGSSSP